MTSDDRSCQNCVNFRKNSQSAYMHFDILQVIIIIKKYDFRSFENYSK